VVGLFAVLPVAALFLSASRGGIVSFCVQILLLGYVLLRSRGLRKRLLAAVVVLLAAFLMVSWLGVGQILQRFSSLQKLEVSEAKRVAMAKGSWRIFVDHPLAGTGLGTLQIVYPPYETLYDGKIVNHSHNDYLEAVAETGVLGGFCCAWFLVVLLRKSFARVRQRDYSFSDALQFSGTVACAGLLVHSFVDYNLHIPSNALLFFLMAHLATADMHQVTPRSTSSAPQPVEQRLESA
ncbi:MAG TPA: O-antigen ligase family protein, partial [Terriglobales bacterium]|nr:O-antigen ligase family protein [Terriglobales bacterium]